MESAPPPVQMVQLLAGFQISQALYAAARLGIPDQLAGGPLRAAEVAERVSAQPGATARLLRDLAGLGVFTEVDRDTYGLTPLGRTLVTDAPGSMRDLALMWMETHYAPFAGLVDTVRTGVPAADAYYGAPFFEWLSGRPDHVARFTGAMANLTDGLKRGALATVDLGAARTLVDIGGADGTVAASLLARAPEARGLVLDLPHVIADCEPALKAFGLGDRLTGVPGNFFESVPAGDFYVLSMVLHDWDDERAGRILQVVREAAQPGARVVGLELVPPPGDVPHMAKMVDLTMLGMLTGRERTEPELRALIEGSGLRFERIEPTPTPMSVLYATVP